MKTFLELKSKKHKYQTPDVEIVIKDCQQIACELNESNDQDFDAGLL